MWMNVLDGEEEDAGPLLIGHQVLSVAVIGWRDVPHPVGPVRVLTVKVEHDAAHLLVVHSPEVLSVIGQRVAGRVDVCNHRPEFGSLGNDVAGEDTENTGIEDSSGWGEVKISGQAFGGPVVANGGAGRVIDDVHPVGAQVVLRC